MLQSASVRAALNTDIRARHQIILDATSGDRLIRSTQHEEDLLKSVFMVVIIIIISPFLLNCPRIHNADCSEQLASVVWCLVLFPSG